MSRRVVLTGCGPVSACGVGMADLREALAASPAAPTEIDRFETQDLLSSLAFAVPPVDVNDYLKGKKTYLDRSSELAMIAMRLAADDAAVDVATLDMSRAGLVLGTAYGSLETMTLFFDDYLQKGARFVKPFLFPHTYANTAISLIAIEWGFTGYHNNFCSGRLSSAWAITDAFDRIRMDAADLVFTGGYDAISEALYLGLEAGGRLSPGDSDGEEHCAPYAEDRNGTIVGEGAGILVLESAEGAAARGARVYGEVLACEFGSDPETVLRTALQNVPPDATVAVLGAADGGPDDNDEVAALRTVLVGRSWGAASLAPYLGQCFGAATALQLAAAAGCASPAPATGDLPPMPTAPDVVLIHSADPGGSHAALVYCPSA